MARGPVTAAAGIAVRDAGPRVASAAAPARLCPRARRPAASGPAAPHPVGGVAHRRTARRRIRPAERGSAAAIRDGRSGPVGRAGRLRCGPGRRPAALRSGLCFDRLRRGAGRRPPAEATGVYPRRLSLFCFARNAAMRAFCESHVIRAAALGVGADNQEGERGTSCARASAPDPGDHQHATTGANP